MANEMVNVVFNNLLHCCIRDMHTFYNNIKNSTLASRRLQRKDIDNIITITFHYRNVQWDKTI